MGYLIVAITALNGAGKGSVAERLVSKHGFDHLSFRQILAEYLKRKQLPETRDNFIMIGNELRNLYGANYIARLIYDRAHEKRNHVVVESVRAPAEIDFFLSKEDVLTVLVNADEGVRFKRVLERGSSTDQVTLEQFREHDILEFGAGSKDPSKQSLEYCAQKARYTLENNSTLESFHAQIDEMIKLYYEKDHY